ncbi:MAG: hypothetical protein ACO3Z2_00540 [Chitinophagaceae bacterium]
MRKIMLFNSTHTRCIQLLILLIFATGCTSTENKNSSEGSNDIDTGRKFVRAALDGKFDQAQQYLLLDTLNLNYLEIAARSYDKLSSADKENYKGASILIHESKSVNDSTSLLIFSNSFKNDRDTLRVVRKENRWVVDLSYLYLHETGSAPQLPEPKKDSLR